MASMVEQFNLKGSKEQFDRNVEISAPIPNHYPGIAIPCQTALAKPRSLSPEQEEGHSEQSTWKENPIFTSNDAGSSDDDDDDDDVPEIIKRLSQNGLPSGKPLSDTLSSDLIVNSISNGREL